MASRRRAKEASGNFGKHKVQGLQCYFHFLQGLLCKMAGTAIHISLSVVYVFVRVCIRFPYPVIQI
jgi:hypothetical protein